MSDNDTLVVSEKSSPVRFRHIRVLEKTRSEGFPGADRSVQFEHVLTLATRLEGNKLYVGYALNRVDKYNYPVGQKSDRYSPDEGRVRATGRLNSKRHLVLDVDRNKPMIDNIIDGLLALPTTDSDAHFEQAMFLGKDISEVPSVPSALKNLLRKSVKEYKNSTRIEG